ncbi:MAG: GTPase HflX, partial [bacterium]|nr:GTPase HflX [bacterium]
TADARMFATLDATLRVLSLPSRRRVVLGDTVGFIRSLPTTLVQAFRATLEEVNEASLLLHVIDAASHTAVEQTNHVHQVLSEIGAAAIPRILVFNKADLLDGEVDPNILAGRILNGGDGVIADSVVVSARSGHGIERLFDLVDKLLPVDPIRRARFRIPASEGHPIHLLHEHARIRDKYYDADWCLIQADAPESLVRQLGEYLLDGS